MFSTDDDVLSEIPLLNALIKLKGRTSGRDFASKLKISPRYWEFVKSGNRPIGMTLLKAITKTYPQLDGYVLTFLRDTNPPTELTQEEIDPVIELVVGKTVGSSKLKIKHNVKCPICGNIYRCSHGQNNHSNGDGGAKT